MKLYLAPMEGITTHIYRNAYNRCFGGIDKYFTPFIASRKLNRRELDEILPEHNENIEVVPQILTNRADEFLQITERIAGYGYRTVNLNLGCPSGTVAARKRGAGFLSVPDELDSFLYEIYERSPIRISVKTRIGVESIDEWERLLAIYRQYPIDELIIHPRLQRELYKFAPHKEAFAAAAAALPDLPLCYNGDITSEKSCVELQNAIPEADCIMIGRGILRNPSLAAQLKKADAAKLSTRENLRAFHDEIFAGYAARMAGETPTLFKMKDLWTYLSESFAASDRYLKKIRKASDYAEYRIAVGNLFRECELSPNLPAKSQPAAKPQV